jgi:hypothetical protein
MEMTDALAAVFDPHYSNPRLQALRDLMRDPAWAAIITDHEVTRITGNPKDYVEVTILTASVLLKSPMAGVALERLQEYLTSSTTFNQSMVRLRVITVAGDTLCLRRNFIRELSELIDVLEKTLVSVALSWPRENEKDAETILDGRALDAFRRRCIKEGLESVGA